VDGEGLAEPRMEVGETPFFFFFTLVTGPRRSLSFKLSDARVYEPQIRAHLGTTAHFCKVVVGETSRGRVRRRWTERAWQSPYRTVASRPNRPVLKSQLAHKSCQLVTQNWFWNNRKTVPKRIGLVCVRGRVTSRGRVRRRWTERAWFRV